MDPDTAKEAGAIITDNIMHFEATDSRGLAIYQDGKQIAQTKDPLKIHALASALMQGQTRIAGVPIPDDLTRFGIVKASMQRLLAGAVT